MQHICNLAKIKNMNAKMKGEALIIDGKRYTQADLQHLPNNLSLSEAKTLPVKNGIAFQGPESYMSNMFPCSIQIQGTEFNSAEQAFCHFKATEHGHQPSAEKILATTDPFAALKIAKGIKECEAWSAGKLDTLEKIVKAKFDQTPVC